MQESFGLPQAYTIAAAVISLLLAVCGFMIVFLLNMILASIRELKSADAQLADKVENLIKERERYVLKDDWRDSIEQLRNMMRERLDDLMAWMTRIESKLDDKADK